MLTAYIAAPLFCDAEKTFNLTIDAALRAAEINTYLPQRDGGEGAAMIATGMDPARVREQLFTADVNAVRRCDLLVMLLDGRVPDEGARLRRVFVSNLRHPVTTSTATPRKTQSTIALR